MKLCKLIRWWLTAILLSTTWCVVGAEAGFAAITVTGSLSTSTTNVPLQITTMQYGSAGVDLDLGQYIRFGLNYGLQVSSSAIYQPVENSSSVALADSANPTCPTVGSCFAVINRSVVTERGFGFTLILWSGDVVMPYITIGGVVKKYTFSTQVNDGLVEARQGQTPPSVSLGAGLVLKLNRDFSLKLNIQASPGVTMRPGDVQPRMMWDKKNTIGLTYQLK